MKDIDLALPLAPSPAAIPHTLAPQRKTVLAGGTPTGSPIAAEALQRIGAFYAVEANIRGAPTDTRCRVRQAETRPLVEAFKPWLEARLAEISKRSALAEAIRYTLGHWDGLTRFLDDGRIKIDNNVVERSIKPVALGRKNSLFAGSIRGAQTWAILASLINTAKLTWNRRPG